MSLLRFHPSVQTLNPRKPPPTSNQRKPVTGNFRNVVCGKQRCFTSEIESCNLGLRCHRKPCGFAFLLFCQCVEPMFFCDLLVFDLKTKTNRSTQRSNRSACIALKTVFDRHSSAFCVEQHSCVETLLKSCAWLTSKMKKTKKQRDASTIVFALSAEVLVLLLARLFDCTSSHCISALLKLLCKLRLCYYLCCFSFLNFHQRQLDFCKRWVKVD